jgi:TonB family protein
VYPDLARHLHISGIARVQVTVGPDGTVKDVKELGGNPVLVEALSKAVWKWKYELGERTSVFEVRCFFKQ